MAFPGFGVSGVELHVGDCRAIMAAMEPASIDTIITDPPYGLSFMGRDWDHGVPGVAFWEMALRVAKPGALLLAFGGTRTWHRLAVAIEDAGWEMRDTVVWLQGQGFPKSHDISKAIDRAARVERVVIGDRVRLGDHKAYGGDAIGWNRVGQRPITAPATDAAAQWAGWGTALKPAWEPILIAMKPLDGTFAQNALRHGVAGLNIDGGRIAANGDDPNVRTNSSRRTERNGERVGNYGFAAIAANGTGSEWTTAGRWPANVILDECAAARQQWTRFFYVAKASRAERNAGLDGLPERDAPRTNNHPTVKPLALMRYLCRLTTTPTGGVIFDPFMGSGTTGIAAVQERRSFVGCDNEPDYVEIARRRIAHALKQGMGRK